MPKRSFYPGTKPFAVKGFIYKVKGIISQSFYNQLSLASYLNSDLYLTKNTELPLMNLGEIFLAMSCFLRIPATVLSASVHDARQATAQSARGNATG